jgi:Tfp pilus assembly ATPase PilU
VTLGADDRRGFRPVPEVRRCSSCGAARAARQARRLRSAHHGGLPPKIRLHGDLIDTEYEPLNGDDTVDHLRRALTEQIARFERELELDMSGLPGIGRFRDQRLIQRGALGAVLRKPRRSAPSTTRAPRDLCEQLPARSRG